MKKRPTQQAGNTPTEKVIFQPRASLAFRKGINQIANLVRPTYGPLPGIVASDRSFLNKSPELLDSGGTIVRRVPQIPDPHANLAAMLVREALKRLQDQVGDGTAAAAILLQTVFNEGYRVVTAGGNAMRLREHLENGLRLIHTELDRMTCPIEGEEALARLALRISSDEELAPLLGEIFDIIGEYGRLEIRIGTGIELEREYVEGMYWEDGLVARELVTDKAHMRADLENPAILMTDLEINSVEQLAPFLDRVVQAGIPSLLMVTKGVSGAALAMLVNPQNQAKIRVAAIKNYDTVGNAFLFMLQDLAILTGGRPILKGAGDTLNSVRIEDLGRARRAWADTQTFGVVGGRGGPRQLRDHITRLREAYQKTSKADDRQKIQQRIGKLLGGSATLWIGASNQALLDERKELAARTAEALRSAMIGGVVPGGGAALLACQPALQKRLAQPGLSLEEAAAYRILLRALEEPLRQIAHSTGANPHLILEQVRRAGEGWGLDARARAIVHLHETGILDPAPVIKAAVHTGVATAALALTTDVLVHRDILLEETQN